MEQFYNLVMALAAIPTLGCIVLAIMNINLRPKAYYKYSGHRWVKKR